MRNPDCGKQQDDNAKTSSSRGESVFSDPPEKTGRRNSLKGIFLSAGIGLLLLIGVSITISLPEFQVYLNTRRHLRARSVMRILSEALDNYFKDHGLYPPPCDLDGMYLENTNPEFSTWIAAFLPSALTTPTSYIRSIPKDPFSKERRPFGYATNFRESWLIASRGKEDVSLTKNGFADSLPIAIGLPSFRGGPYAVEDHTDTRHWRLFRVQIPDFFPAEYSATNGTFSGGPVFRVPQ